MAGRPRTRAKRADDTTDPAERAREIALRLLDHSPRSSAQLRAGLLQREVDPDTADLIIERYTEVGLLDDAALAATIARTRHRERGLSRRAVADELRRKGFDAEDAEAALEQISTDDEREAARELGEQRWRRLSSHDSRTRSRRVASMLARKGYSPSLAFEVVRELERADNDGESV
ncbi:regulatory protein RecX [Demequina sp. NBRC 110054]|uniref:regulatory protein RecX n=1 Tax=Demequina sp. NBRC 110054 TaxID=1570343 RepID=UPI0009FD6EB3|nr:regulatory protein RecX [Demequina sp. NBRC 110054]